MDPNANKMASSHDKPSKWKGRATSEFTGPSADQIWPFLEDFFGLHKWFPTLTTCIPVEGIPGKPGCVRYCSGFRTPVDDNEMSDRLNWTKQKLLSIDTAKRVFSYSIVDSNVGFNSYVSTVRVVPRDGGCSIVWEYEVEPVKGWTSEDLDRFIGNGLKVMAQRMEETVLNQQMN